MSINRKLWGWCRVPPKEQVRTSSWQPLKPVLACALIGVVLVSSIVFFYATSSFTAISAPTLASSSLSVISTMPASNFTDQYPNGSGFQLGNINSYRDGTTGDVEFALVNFNQTDVHLTSVYLYDNYSWTWSQKNLTCVVPANSGIIVHIPLNGSLSVTPEAATFIESNSGTTPIRVQDDVPQMQVQDNQSFAHTACPYPNIYIEIETLEGYAIKTSVVPDLNLG